jgi:dTDP-4-amino-4,6-dideoxygalactose transaminase
VVLSFTTGKTLDAGEGGAVLTDRRDIYEQLLRDLQAAGRIADLDPSVSSGLSRDEQYQKLELVLSNVVKGVV